MSQQNVIQSLKAAGLTELQIQAALAAGRTAAAATVAHQAAQAWSAGVAAGAALGERLKALRGGRGAMASQSLLRPVPKTQTAQAAPKGTDSMLKEAKAAGAAAAARTEGKAVAERLKAVRGSAYRWRAD